LNLKKLTAGLICLATCALLTPSPAHAQQMTWTDRGFFNANIGIQFGSHELTTTSTFTLYDEPGSLATAQDVDGGLFFDVNAGYKVWRNLAVGVGYTRVSSDSDVAIAAQVPDPVFFDRPRPLAATASSEHSENAIHLFGAWMMPVTDKIDVGFTFGPTIFMVQQDVPTAITVNEPGPTLATTSIESVDKTTVGVNFGVDVTYLVTPRVGAGFIARYTWGSADIDGADDSLTVGGFQMGAGVRVRF
jgi:hypothetical protein